MAFLIPDNLRSRDDTPAAIRRVAAALMVGLDDKCVVWYEPLFDPSAEKPHFVVLIPDRGIAVLEVLEVKARGILGVLRGHIRLDVAGIETKAGSPLERADRLASIFESRVSNEPRLAGVNVPIGAGAILTTVTRDEAKNRGLDRVLDFDRCLFRSDIESATEGEGEANLMRVFTRLVGPPLDNFFEDKTECLIRGLIQPEIVIDQVSDSEQMRLHVQVFRPPGAEENPIRVMDRRQESMAKSLGEGHRVIRGVAGSGKTLILVYRARLLSRIMPKGRILVACYTRALASQLRSLLADHDNIVVQNLDRLMAQIIRAAGMKHPGYNNKKLSPAEVALSAVKRTSQPRYDAVFLDEAQDFGTEELMFAVQLLKEGKRDLLVVADAAQNIFRRRFSWKEAGIQAQGRTRILRINYRNTRQILEFASNFLLADGSIKTDSVPNIDDENTVIPPEAAVREGPPPRVFILKDPKLFPNRVLNEVKEAVKQRSAPGSIAVLYPGQYERGFPLARSIHDRLQESQLDVLWVTDPENPKARDGIATAASPIVLSTIHSAKGLEFPFVIMAGISQEGKEPNRLLAYVGMTRAIDRLTVISTEQSPFVQDLKNAIAMSIDDEAVSK